MRKALYILRKVNNERIYCCLQHKTILHLYSKQTPQIHALHFLAILHTISYTYAKILVYQINFISAQIAHNLQLEVIYVGRFTHIFRHVLGICFKTFTLMQASDIFDCMMQTLINVYPNFFI